MLAAMAFGTGLVQVPAGTALLTAYPVALGFLLGSSGCHCNWPGATSRCGSCTTCACLGRTCRWCRGSGSC